MKTINKFGLIVLGIIVLTFVLIIFNRQIFNKTANIEFIPVVTEPDETPDKIVFGPVKDDWVYDESQDSNRSSGSIKALTSLSLSSAPSFNSGLASDSLGFAVGGAKDINNFRKNIEQDYLPLASDISYEGLF